MVEADSVETYGISRSWSEPCAEAGGGIEGGEPLDVLGAVPVEVYVLEPAEASVDDGMAALRTPALPAAAVSSGFGVSGRYFGSDPSRQNTTSVTEEP